MVWIGEHMRCDVGSDKGSGGTRRALGMTLPILILHPRLPLYVSKPFHILAAGAEVTSTEFNCEKFL